MGESANAEIRIKFDRGVRREFRGATITSDAGLLAGRELDEALGLACLAADSLQESRTGLNVEHGLVPLYSTPRLDLMSNEYRWKSRTDPQLLRLERLEFSE